MATEFSTDGVVACVREALYEVLDPDLGVNIMDLGFVRSVVVEDECARLTMTLTSPACPLTGVMEDQIRTVLTEAADSPVKQFTIAWEWLPTWTPAAISEDGREQLNAIGFSL